MDQYILRLEVIDDSVDFDIDEVAQEISQLLRGKYGMKVAEWADEETMLIAMLDERLHIKRLLDEYMASKKQALNQEHIEKLNKKLEENNRSPKF